MDLTSKRSCEGITLIQRKTGLPGISSSFARPGMFLNRASISLGRPGLPLDRMNNKGLTALKGMISSARLIKTHLIANKEMFALKRAL